VPACAGWEAPAEENLWLEWMIILLVLLSALFDIALAITNNFGPVDETRKDEFCNEEGPSIDSYILHCFQKYIIYHPSSLP
jgi:hypothetical protein